MQETDGCFNSTDWECIHHMWGAQSESNPNQLILFTLVLILIFVFGLLGNIITCIVIPTTKFMHTATNFYLLNLSVSDLIVLISRLPYEIFIKWNKYPFPNSLVLCMGSGFFSEMCAYSSALTVAAFTVERYCAICHPMLFGRTHSLSRAIKTIIVIWIISAALSGVMVSQLGLELLLRNDTSTNFTVKVLEQSRICDISIERTIPYSFFFSSFIFFVIPMILITTMYIRIGIVVHSSMQPRKQSTESVRSNNSLEKKKIQQGKARKSVLKLLVAIVIAFFLCYAPFHLSRIIGSLYQPDNPIFCKECILTSAFRFIEGISAVFFFGSSIVNPVLYNLMSLKFRKAFYSTVGSMCRCFRRRSNCTNRNVAMAHWKATESKRMTPGKIQTPLVQYKKQPQVGNAINNGDLPQLLIFQPNTSRHGNYSDPFGVQNLSKEMKNSCSENHFPFRVVCETNLAKSPNNNNDQYD